MNELSNDSISAKQGNKARLLVRFLAGLLVINLLTVGIGSWAKMSRASVATTEIVEDKQPSPRQQDAIVALVKTTIISRHADAQPAVQERIVPSADNISKANVTSPIIPTESPVPPVLVPSVALPATVPPSDGLEEALVSLKKLLASDQGALSGIPFAAAAPAPTVVPSTTRSPEPRIEAARELPVQSERPVPAFLYLVNPRETGGDIRYEVDGVSFSLLPGEYQQIPLGAEHEIEFHRGDDFGDAKLVVREGVYRFGVGSAGWKLEQSQKDLEASLSLAPSPHGE